MAQYISHIVQQHETLQSIATTKLHNVSLWSTLARINHLDFPYIVKTHHQKEAGLVHRDANNNLNPLHWVTYGDEIQVPISLSRGNLDLISNKSRGHAQKVYDSTLGMDLKLGFYQDNHASSSNLGDQVEFLEVNDKGNDLARVSGIRNLLQSLNNRLITAQGSMPYHPYFGSRLNELIGSNSTATPDSLCQDIATEIERTINTDNRVKKCSVTECHLIDEDFFAVVSIQPIDPYTAFTMYVQSANDGQIQTSLDNNARQARGGNL